jgi:hypothetical protein
MRSLTIAGLLVACLFSGCASDKRETSASISPKPSASSSTDTRSYGPRSSPPALPTAKEDQKLVVENFFRSLEPLCRDFAVQVGNPPLVDAKRFSEAKVTKEQSPGKWLLEDGEGIELVVDTTGWKADSFPSGGVEPQEGAWVVTGVGGPRDLIPRPYQFGCPEDVFVGTADD